MAIGEKIRAYRLQKDLSLTELSVRSGISETALFSAEQNDQLHPSDPLLTKISFGLEIELEELLTDSQTNLSPLDEEWMAVAHEAMASGLSLEQFKAFLESRRQQTILNVIPTLS